MDDVNTYSYFYAGPIEFVEPDLSSMSTPVTRPMSPDPATSDKRDSLTEKQKQGVCGKVVCSNRVWGFFFFLRTF